MFMWPKVIFDASEKFLPSQKTVFWRYGVREGRGTIKKFLNAKLYRTIPLIQLSSVGGGGGLWDILYIKLYGSLRNDYTDVRGLYQLQISDLQSWGKTTI